jgi:membrane-bound ClpP family serine protease
MQIPQAPANLTAEQVTELNQKLSHMRHEINNQLSLVVAALELIRFKPDARDKMLNTISEQPNKIIAEMQKFSTEFEKTIGIKRD